MRDAEGGGERSDEGITEAIAKPEAARPERSGIATERGARPNKNKKQ